MNVNVLYSADEIREKVQAIGKDISAYYAGKPLVLICVLKGACIFFADLVRSLTVDVELDFVRLSSYKDATSSSGRVVFSKDIEIDVQGKHVLIIEDIVDSGQTMAFLINVLNARNPESVKICALIDKRERRELEMTVDFSCFPVHQGFIVGYGLDYAEKYRQLPDICTLDIEEPGD